MSDMKYTPCVAVEVRADAIGRPTFVQCNQRRFKQKLCGKHYAMAKDKAEMRGRFNAVNIQRRFKTSTGLKGRQWVKYRKQLARERRAEANAPAVEASYGG
jgi:hypothetical protein